MLNGKLMTQKIKNFISKVLQSIGYKIVGRKKIVKHNSFDAIIYYIIENILNVKNKIIIFDIGANDGGSIKRFKKYFPFSNIHSFEPTEHLVKKMKSSINLDDIKINQIAVGKENSKRKFYFYNSHRVNSFFPMEEKSKYKIQRTKEKLKVSEEKFEEVKVITVDHYCEENKISYINLLKIDTQGSEAEVLQGAKNILKKQLVDVIELEYILGIAHVNSNSLYDIEKSLYEFGYKLIAIESSGNVLSFSNYQTNLIYVKNEIFKEIKNFHEKNIDVKNITNAV